MYVESAERLIQADVDARDNSLQTPLHKAAYNGHAAAASALLSFGANSTTRDMLYVSSLSLAMCVLPGCSRPAAAAAPSI